MNDNEKTQQTQNDGVAGADTTASTLFDEGQQQQQAAGSEQQPPTPAKPDSVTLSKEQIQELISGTAKAVQPPAQEQKLSQEELNKLLNVFRVQPQHAQKLGLQAETAVEALQEIIDAAVRQAVTMSAYQQEALKRDFIGQLTPLRSFAQEQQEQKMRTEFMSTFPEFKGYEPLLETVYRTMVAEGTRFDTREKAFEAVAERARAVITKLPGVGQQSQKQAASATTGKKMSTLSGGGQGGGGGSTKGGEKTTAQMLFGP